MDVKFHDTHFSNLEEQTFPLNVQELLNSLKQATLPTATAENATSDAQELQSRAHDSALQLSATINTTAASIAMLSEIHDEFGPRHTRPLWSLLFGSIGSAYYGDVVFHEDAHFAMPRGYGRLEGTATMLMSYVARRADHNLSLDALTSSCGVVQAEGQSSELARDCIVDEDEDADMNAESGSHGSAFIGSRSDLDSLGLDAEPDAEDDDSSTSYEADEDFEEDSNEDETSYSDHPMWDSYCALPPVSFFDPGPFSDLKEKPDTTGSNEPPLALPSDVHILAGRGDRFSVTFPILAIADSDNLVPLLVAVAYQRSIWSIELPVIGLEISEFGRIARVHIAWIDERHGTAQSVPHIIRPGVSSGTTTGTFDLGSPHEALLLTRFLLSIRRQFSEIRSVISVDHIRSGTWRCDSIDVCSQIFADRIVQWVSHIESDGSSNVSSTDSSSPLTPTHPTLTPSWDNTMAPRKQQATSPDVPPGNLAVPVAKPARSPSDTTRSVRSGKSSQVSGRLSNSDFAKVEAGGLNSRKNITSWLLHRNVFRIPFLKLSGVPNEPTKNKGVVPHIDSMVDIYNEATRFEWPEEWKALDDLPVVDSTLTELRKELFDQYQGIKNEAWAQTPFTGQLSNLSALLISVRRARGLQSQAVNVLEAESRHDWDSLLYRFFCTEEEVTSPCVLLERDIVFVRNPLARDLAEGNATDAMRRLEEWQGHINAWYDQCVAAKYMTATHTSPLYLLHDQAADAVAVARFVSAEVAGYKNNLDTSRAFIQKQASVEPGRGKCDAVLYAASTLDQSGGTTFKLVITSKKSPKAGITEAAKKSPSIQPTAIIPQQQPPHFPTVSFMNLHSCEPDTQKTATKPLIDNKPTTGRIPNRILLPCLLAEYKKPEKTTMAALNQVRTYCVSSVMFLSIIGIKEYPVFGLVTNGSVGGIIMCYMVAENSRIYLMERNVRTFDLTNVLQAFQFVTILRRLRKQSEELQTTFKKYKSELERRLEAHELDDWAAARTVAKLSAVEEE